MGEGSGEGGQGGVTAGQRFSGRRCPIDARTERSDAAGVFPHVREPRVLVLEVGCDTASGQATRVTAVGWISARLFYLADGMWPLKSPPPPVG